MPGWTNTSTCPTRPASGALQALGRFAERLEGLELEGFRAVATNTFRVAHNIGPFLKEASAVLGHPIEVVAGREEARLIYLGAAQGSRLQPDEHCQ